LIVGEVGFESQAVDVEWKIMSYPS
jgi:hypothetical protein